MSQSLTLKPELPPALAAFAQLFFWLSQDRPAALWKSVKVDPSTEKGRCVSLVWVTCVGESERAVFLCLVPQLCCTRRVLVRHPGQQTPPYSLSSMRCSSARDAGPF